MFFVGNNTTGEHQKQMSKRYAPRAQNKNSRIETEWRGLVSRRSETARRDEGTLTAEVETSSNNSTLFQIRKGPATLDLTGHEARTLFQLLSSHYDGMSYMD
jgi:hypothetical protein